jgi:anti-sigma factor RsiW
MTNHEHERATDLIIRRGVEEIAAPDAAWLESHLAMCSECAEYVSLIEGTEQLLRSAAVTASPALVIATQSRVRARALHLQEQQSRMVLIAISFCIGVLSSTVSAWLWWKFGSWVAARLGLSTAIVEPGILLFLLLPAVVIAVLMLAFPRPVFDESVLLRWAGSREGENR